MDIRSFSDPEELRHWCLEQVGGLVLVCIPTGEAPPGFLPWGRQLVCCAGIPEHLEYATAVALYHPRHFSRREKEYWRGILGVEP